MFQKLFAFLATLAVAFVATTGVGHAAVEINTADQAQLESVKGLGPSLSGKIIAERKKAAFKDWADVEGRVAGVGEKNAMRLSDAGLTVAGQPKAATSAPARPADAKPARASKKAGDVASADPTLTKK